jgi:cyclic-di-AMP phosphodiesterase PgpH
VKLREQIERAIAAEVPDREAQIRYHGPRAALALLLAIFTYAMFPASPAVDVPIYEVGSVASNDVIAPFAFEVPKPAEELERERTEIARAAEPVFVYVQPALDSARARLDGFRDAIGRAATIEDPRARTASLREAASVHGVQLSDAEANYLANTRARENLLTTLRGVLDRWLAAGVMAGGTIDSLRGEVLLRMNGEERRVRVENLTTFPTLVARARLIHPDPGSPAGDAIYLRLLTRFFHPTIVADPVATVQREEELRRSVPTRKYEVRAGEKIIGANEVVGRAEHEKLRALRDFLESRRGEERGARRVVGAILFNFLVIALFGIALVLFRPRLYGDIRSMALIAAVFTVVLVAAGVIGKMPHVRPELIPVVFAAVILSALFDQRISMIAVMVLAVLIGAQASFRGTNALFLNLIGGAVAAITVRAVSRRNESFRWILMIAIAYFVAATAIGWTLDLPMREVLRSAGWGGLNAAASVVLALQLLPVAEHFTGIETDLTLLEWSDLNRPLMQRLSLEAPGTYAHTIVVANLAESACRAIGASALLARVGCYYHDIGKLQRPQYFVENQPKGWNPHDKLAPGNSATIIRNHVREGLKLAEEHGLPRKLRAFITEHHGTGEISYFLEKAREGGNGVSDPGNYAYPGPRPQSAETAVVMLADGVEAAVRVLNEPTPERIREVVEHIVRQRIDQGQLRDAPLTLRQIDGIKEEFIRVLAGMYHNRIDYPAASGGVTSEFAAT